MKQIARVVPHLVAGMDTTDSVQSHAHARQLAKQAAGSGHCICNGAGFLRKDVPVSHPDFGRLVPYQCLLARQETARQAELSQKASNWSPALMKLCTWERFHLLQNGETGNLAAFRVAYRYALRVPHMLDQLEQGRIAELVTEGIKPWLIFYGPPGTGKTHLAAAIGNHLVARGLFALFTIVPSLLDNLRRESWQEHGGDDLLQRVVETPLLIMDDLGVEKATAWASERLYVALNHRYTHLLPTIITTNAKLQSFDPRITSRLRDKAISRHVRLHLPDYRFHQGHGLQDMSASRAPIMAALERETRGRGAEESEP